jgi:hypothetical protein
MTTQCMHTRHSKYGKVFHAGHGPHRRGRKNDYDEEDDNSGEESMLSDVGIEMMARNNPGYYNSDDFQKQVELRKKYNVQPYKIVINEQRVVWEKAYLEQERIRKAVDKAWTAAIEKIGWDAWEKSKKNEEWTREFVELARKGNVPENEIQDWVETMKNMPRYVYSSSDDEEDDDVED